MGYGIGVAVLGPQDVTYVSVGALSEQMPMGMIRYGIV